MAQIKKFWMVFEMGSDRTSSIEVNGFTLSVDKDHLGSYRGHQVISSKYRGWHYHLESRQYNEIEIMGFIEEFLKKLGAIRVKEKTIYHIGNVRIFLLKYLIG